MYTVDQFFIRVHEIFVRFARASLSRIFPATNQSLSYGCYGKTGLDKAWSGMLVVANQFIGSKT